MRDFRASVALALECGAEKELEHEIEEWMGKASEFWRGKAAQTGEEKAAKRKARPKLFRVGARDWLASADCMLKATADRSILDYVVTAGMQQAVPPSRWPALTICIDQGSDGMAAVSYLMNRLSCNILVLPDPSHRVWNDCQLALKAAKLWGLTMVMSKVFSLDHGPWADAKWYEQSKEAADVYLAATGCSCPLFQELLGRILSDTGDASRIAEQGIELDMEVDPRCLPAQNAEGLHVALVRVGEQCAVHAAGLAQEAVGLPLHQHGRGVGAACSSL